MSQPSPLATPLAWNLVAADYATDIVPIFSTFAKKAVTMAGVGKGARVLDVAAGPGTLASSCPRYPWVTLRRSPTPKSAWPKCAQAVSRQWRSSK